MGNNLAVPAADPSVFSNMLCALVAAFVIGLFFGKRFISFLKEKLPAQPVRAYVPINHMSKQGTSNMGGFVIFVPLYATWLLFGNVGTTWYILAPLLIFNVLGFIDDYLKMVRRNSVGVRPKFKLVSQCAGAMIFVMLAYMHNEKISEILVPFYGYWDIGFWGIAALGTLTIVATSNSTNLTDGLDGLVSLPLITSAIFMAYIATALGSGADFAVISAGFIGSVLSFLWYNAYPAKVFMGDNGSLTSGAFIGFLGVLLGMELFLLVVGLLFVIEALSVMAQLFYLRKTKGRRIFLMAPIHHHFEHLGMHETTITVRFWIFASICLAFATSLFIMTPK